MTEIKDRYLAKKIQKIVTALYLVTSHIKDSDPLKWSIRTKALELMSQVADLKDIDVFSKEAVLEKAMKDVSVIIDELRLAHDVHLVNALNFSILTSEIENFLREINVYKSVDLKIGLVAPFQIDHQGSMQQPEVVSEDARKRLAATVPDKGHKGQIKDNRNAQPRNPDGDRRKIIVDMLRKHANLTIKDFTVAIKNCSAKTIQRELMAMVTEGVLYKKGDRRWSTYSLTA